MEAQPPPQPTPPLLSQQPHYPDSLDSSPRSRNTDSWDESYPPPTANKIRLMVSYGGHISPRPHDKTLCYIGGDTRIVVVDRYTSLSELSTRFSKTFLNGLAFALKYQLPDEDLDSLISVTTDEDFENMIEEFDHRSCNSSPSKPSRIRLFLFPAKPGSSEAVSVFDGPGSGLGSGKSEDWLTGSGFLDGVISDSASVNCLLGLDEEVGASRNGSTNFASGLEEAAVQVGSGKNLKPGHDVQSVPDSPIGETNSSFGSTSSSVANLPSIRVRVEDGGNTGGVVRGQDQKVEGIEESFAKLGVGAVGQKQDEEIVMLASPVNVSPLPVSSAAVAAGEYQSRVLSDDERSDHGVPVGCRKLPNSEQSQSQSQSQAQALTPQFQQKSTAVVDLPSPDSVSSNSITNATLDPKSVNATNEDVDQVQIQSVASRVAITSGDPNHSVSDPQNLVQMQQHVLDPGYVLQHPFGQQQQQALQHQFDQQQQQALQHQFDQQQQALQHQFDQQQEQHQQKALQHQFDQQHQQALQHQVDQQQQHALQHQFDQQQQQQALQHQVDQQQQQQALQHQVDQQQQHALQHQFDQQQQQQQALQHKFDQQQQQALQQQFDQQQQQALQQQRQQKLALHHQFGQQQQQQALQHQFDQQQQQALEHQFDQQQQHHQQQTLQHQFDKQQQQEAPQPQQIIHGTHFIHQTPAGPVSIPAYYPVYPPQQQLHPQHHYQLDQQYPVYYLPARQTQAYNLSMQQQANLGESATTITSSQPQIPPNIASAVPPSAAYIPTGNAPLPNSEVITASAYRKLAAGTPQLVQVPSNQHQQQYVAYSQIHHLSQPVAPNSAAPPNYAYNYADPAHAQIFYAQNLAPTKPSQSRP